MGTGFAKLLRKNRPRGDSSGEASQGWEHLVVKGLPGFDVLLGEPRRAGEVVNQAEQQIGADS
jgi:hypothetical protein